ncbi:MAG: hypothetical protein GEV07_12945 [Streptosporangiales bacterium]|nr:hypothetical protein [Streptosporangiales bacterium]
MPPADKPLPAEIDTTKPSLARVYDAMLGGKDNFDVDRDLYEKMSELVPETRQIAWDNRALLNRVVRWLSNTPGIDQFIDVGSGLPTAENTHEVALRANPDATVVYVDNDPSVCAHGRALLEDSDHTYFTAADLTDPDAIFGSDVVTAHIDLDRPIAVLHFLTLHHIADHAEVERVVQRYVELMPAGSYLALTHFQQADGSTEEGRRFLEAASRYRASSPGFTARTKEQLESMMRGLELVEPGLVPVVDWWPDGPATAPRSFADFLIGGVGRKP